MLPLPTVSTGLSGTLAEGASVSRLLPPHVEIGRVSSEAFRIISQDNATFATVSTSVTSATLASATATGVIYW